MGHINGILDWSGRAHISNLLDSDVFAYHQVSALVL